MANMEFYKENHADTTTILVVDSATGLVDYLIDRNVNTKYITDGYDSTTSAVISVEFASPTVLSNVFLQNHNLKQFRMFYNSTTASVFSSDINLTTNSNTSSFFSFDSVTVNSIQLQMDDTIEGSAEKEIGQIVVTESELQFERNPTSKSFKPTIDRTQVRHVMADGGIALHNIRDKYKVKIKFAYITSTFYDSLLDLYSDGSPMYYVPFPTTTTWDGGAYEVVWSKDFNFTYSSNNKPAGYSGDILLEETSNG